MQAIQAQVEAPRPEKVTLYGDGNAGERIAKVLAGVPLRFTKRLTY